MNSAGESLRVGMNGRGVLLLLLALVRSTGALSVATGACNCPELRSPLASGPLPLVRDSMLMTFGLTFSPLAGQGTAPRVRRPGQSKLIITCVRLKESIA